MATIIVTANDKAKPTRNRAAVERSAGAPCWALTARLPLTMYEVVVARPQELNPVSVEYCCDCNLFPSTTPAHLPQNVLRPNLDDMGIVLFYPGQYIGAFSHAFSMRSAQGILSHYLL